MGWGRHEDGHGNTPFRHDDALQFFAADPIQDVQALRLELAGAHGSAAWRRFTQLVIGEDQKINEYALHSRCAARAVLRFLAHPGKRIIEPLLVEGVRTGGCSAALGRWRSFTAL